MSNYTIECNIYSMYLKIMYCSDKTKKKWIFQEGNKSTCSSDVNKKK